MSTTHKSLFNLIEIFRKSSRKIKSRLLAKGNCDTHHIHDFYCERDEPYVDAA